MLSTLWSKIKSFISRLDQPIIDLWNNDRVFLLIFGLIIVIVKFRGLLISFIVAASQAMIKKDDTINTILVNQENQDNNEANQDVQQANNLPNQEPPVDPDWYEGK